VLDYRFYHARDHVIARLERGRSAVELSDPKAPYRFAVAGFECVHEDPI
jgi:hypothetical protein